MGSTGIPPPVPSSPSTAGPPPPPSPVSKMPNRTPSSLEASTCPKKTRKPKTRPPPLETDSTRRQRSASSAEPVPPLPPPELTLRSHSVPPPSPLLDPSLSPPPSPSEQSGGKAIIY